MTYEELEADERRDRYCEWLEDQPKCRRCGKLWKEKDGVYDEENDEYFCDQRCVDNYEQDKAEAANERRYSGEGPVSARERQMQEWQEYRRLKQ